MTVSSGDDLVEIKDILVGEVWFASGQSNMECPIWGGGTRYRDMKGGSRNPAFELAGADGKWQPAKIENYRKDAGQGGTEVDTDYIDSSEIVLSSEAVPEPVKVRYMGKPRTAGTLYNEVSLPLGPFETK